MFVRRKKNRSGSTSVVVVDKHGGKFKELHTVGIGHTPDEVDELTCQGRNWIQKHLGILELDFEGADRKLGEIAAAEMFLDSVDSILQNGAKLIIDKVYDAVGFNKIPDDVLRHLVVARLCQPMSKMATVDYLKSHFDEDLHLSKIYRYLDKLYNSQQEWYSKSVSNIRFPYLEGGLRCCSMMSLRYISRVSGRTICAVPDFQKTERVPRHRLSLDCWYARTAIRYPIQYLTVRNMKATR